MKKNMKTILAVLVLVAIVVVTLVIGAIIDKNTPTKKRADLYEQYQMEQGQQGKAAIILQNQLLEEKALLEDGRVYIKLDTIKQQLNSRFYWDRNENLVLYTTPTQVIRAEVGDTAYRVNKKKESEEYMIAKMQTENGADTIYLSLDFVQKYTNLEYKVIQEPDRVWIQYVWGEREEIQVKEKNTLRIEHKIKSPILADVAKGDTLTVLEKEGKWYRAQDSNGVIGYIQKKYVSAPTTEKRIRKFTEPEYTSLTKEEKICMAWHQVDNADANNYFTDYIADTDGLNVISPTWFRISDNKGNIRNIADANYVKLVHKLGMEVWAMVDDQASESDDNIVFASRSIREKLIDNLISAVQEYDIDGLNVDFEYVKEEYAEDYVQFLRELSVECRNNNIILSIDNYVPKEFNAYYNRKEQGILADYVVIMGYDEHNKSSTEAGSVASLPFVREGIQATIAEVPSHKVINAMPFYTRIWCETPEEYAQSGSKIIESNAGNYALSSRALGMEDVESELNQKGIQPVWNETLGQYYAEYEEENSTYMVWLEEEKSIEEKLKLVDQYQLGGVSAWRLGFEREKTWKVIKKYMKK